MKIRNILLLFVLVSFFACKPELDDFTTSNGGADFTKYVAIGNSLTAGYTDGDLFKSGQENSYPSMLAYQMQAAGGGEFKQPMMLDEYGFGKRLLLDVSRPGPVPADGTPNQGNYASIADQGPFNNMGVPGAKSFHLITPGYATLNPYFGRFATGSMSTVLEDAAAQQPTFFSCWIGANDVLTYALAGGAADSVTDINTFSYSVNLILQTMTANGAKGVVANIPEITSIPYFTFMNTQLPYAGLVLDAEQAATLNYAYASFEQYLESVVGITWSYGFNFVEGPNAFVVEDETLPLPAPFNVRQMTAGELFLLTLPTDSLMNHGMGSVNQAGTQPVPYGIPDKYFISIAEKTEIHDAITEYNKVLDNLATTYGLAFVDMHSKMNEAATTGIEWDGITFTSTFIYGNAFSLDGVHMTGKGYALATNFFIKEINDTYKSQIKYVNTNLYPGLYYYQ